MLRPVDPTCFNHTVLLNWQNVSAGYEQRRPERGRALPGLRLGWSQRAGDRAVRTTTWHGSSGAASARGMVDEDPERYGMLQHPGDPDSFDIFADAARVVGPGRSTGR